MHARSIHGVLLLAVLIAALTGMPALAKDKAEIVDVSLERTKGNLEVSFRLHDCFSPKMEEAIRAGIPTTFRFRIVVEKQRRLPLFQSPLVDIVFEHTIKYDRLRDRYRVQLPEQPERELTTTDFEEAKRSMSSVKDLPLIPLWRLGERSNCQVLLKAELSKFYLPLLFRYIFFFVSLWDFETDWYKVTF
ncbi:MAG: DUF4390 domain-containing protein [Syntrophobacteraceae bacterium]